MRDDLIAIEPDPVALDHVTVAEAVEPEHRIRAISAEEHDTLIARCRFQLVKHPRDRPDLQPSLANISLPAITCGEERQILVRKPPRLTFE